MTKPPSRGLFSWLPTKDFTHPPPAISAAYVEANLAHTIYSIFVTHHGVLANAKAVNGVRFAAADAWNAQAERFAKYHKRGNDADNPQHHARPKHDALKIDHASLPDIKRDGHKRRSHRTAKRTKQEPLQGRHCFFSTSSMLRWVACTASRKSCASSLWPRRPAMRSFLIAWPRAWQVTPNAASTS